MEIEYTEAYAVFFFSFKDQKVHFNSMCATDKLAKLAVALHDANERNGFWFAVKYRWDESLNKWVKDGLVK